LKKSADLNQFLSILDLYRYIAQNIGEQQQAECDFIIWVNCPYNESTQVSRIDNVDEVDHDGQIVKRYSTILSAVPAMIDNMGRGEVGKSRRDGKKMVVLFIRKQIDQIRMVVGFTAQLVIGVFYFFGKVGYDAFTATKQPRQGNAVKREYIQII